MPKITADMKTGRPVLQESYPKKHPEALGSVQLEPGAHIRCRELKGARPPEKAEQPGVIDGLLSFTEGGRHPPQSGSQLQPVD